MVENTCLIDGFGPLPMVRPGSVADLGGLVRQAAADNQAIYPVGGQTQLDLGHSPTKSGRAVDLRGLDQVIDFPARDMTITVQAGIAVARLQALIAAENLRLPIDVPQSEVATLGGILATNVSGPRRLGFGTLRDYVIGVSAVNDEGNEFKAGGRVVKNVAGYDLCKLLVGSLGTLGIITQATLKLRPRAEEQALIAIGSDHDGLGALLDQVHESRTRPVCWELLNQTAARAVFHQAHGTCPDAPWTIVVGYEGNSAAVHWQVQQLVNELGAGRSLDTRVGAAATTLWQALVEQPDLARAAVLLKFATTPSDLVRVCSLVQAQDPASALRAHAGNGIVYAARNVSDGATPDRLAIPGVTPVVMRCPLDWKRTVPVWGKPRGDVALMRAIKQRFDPRNVLNPGRFVDGIERL